MHGALDGSQASGKRIIGGAGKFSRADGVRSLLRSVKLEGGWWSERSLSGCRKSAEDHEQQKNSDAHLRSLECWTQYSADLSCRRE